MERASYIKITSYTQKRIADYRVHTQRLCERIGINFDQWNDLMFDTGCTWAENNIAMPGIKDKMLTDEKYGYWNWWLCRYLVNDYNILKGVKTKSIQDYQNDKRKLSNLSYEEIQKETEQRASRVLVSDAE